MENLTTIFSWQQTVWVIVLILIITGKISLTVLILLAILFFAYLFFEPKVDGFLKVFQKLSEPFIVEDKGNKYTSLLEDLKKDIKRKEKELKVSE